MCILLPHDRGHAPHNTRPQEDLVGFAFLSDLFQCVDVGLDRQMQVSEPSDVGGAADDWEVLQLLQGRLYQR